MNRREPPCWGYLPGVDDLNANGGIDESWGNEAVRNWRCCWWNLPLPCILDFLLSIFLCVLLCSHLLDGPLPLVGFTLLVIPRFSIIFLVPSDDRRKRSSGDSIDSSIEPSRYLKFLSYVKIMERVEQRVLYYFKESSKRLHL